MFRTRPTPDRHSLYSDNRKFPVFSFPDDWIMFLFSLSETIGDKEISREHAHGASFSYNFFYTNDQASDFDHKWLVDENSHDNWNRRFIVPLRAPTIGTPPCPPGVVVELVVKVAECSMAGLKVISSPNSIWPPSSVAGG